MRRGDGGLVAADLGSWPDGSIRSAMASFLVSSLARAADRVLRWPVRSWVAVATALCGLALQGGAARAADADEPQAYVAFVEDFASTCVSRNGVQVLVKSTHPSRKLRVWLDRYHMGVGTGDRSRTDLLPNAPPEALGCSRTTTGVQEWRVVRAAWID